MGRSYDHFNLAVRADDRVEDVLVVAVDAGGAGVSRLIGEFSPGVNDMLNLLQKSRGEFVGIVEVEKVPAYYIFQLETPKVEQGLVDVEEAAFAIEGISNIGDEGEGGVVNMALLQQPLPEFQVALLSLPLEYDRGMADSCRHRDAPGQVLTLYMLGSWRAIRVMSKSSDNADLYV